MDWTELNCRGLIPGPQESEVTFLSRVASATTRSNHQGVERQLFDMSPDWVAVEISNRGLAPWHGAVTTIDQCQAALQVRKKLPRWYDRDELVAHELVHVGRVAFYEPKFEEFFAYRTSKSRLRRWLGPIIQRPWEVWLLLLILLLGAWSPVIPLTFISYGFTRLIWRHVRLYMCLGWLETRLDSRERAWAVAYRLTDREIVRAAKGLLKSDRTLRWEMLSAVYGLSC
jgi:hypothetical protein